MTNQTPPFIDGRGPRPALVVIGDTAACGCEEPLDERLLAALPPAARVLELRTGSSALQHAYCRAHSACDWTVLKSSSSLDLSDVAAQGQFDLIVLPDVLPWLDNPQALLLALVKRVARDGRLVLSSDNHASLGTLNALIDGDLSLESRHAPLPGQPRLMSPASIYKLLMDAGWMPSLANHRPEVPAAPPVTAAVEALTVALGLPLRGSTQQIHGMAKLIVDARPLFADAVEVDGRALFDVLVPTNDERQLRLNVESSAGLQEVGARIVSYRGAADAAEAFEQGRKHVDADWVLMCHQDVYFPAGFGRQLNAVLAAIPVEERATTLLGFIGMGTGPTGQGRVPAGFVIDRLARADHPGSGAAVSIDELAVVLARDSILRIDPTLGWHLWATDLSLGAICTHHRLPRIVRLPLFHNSRTGWQLPPAFHRSAELLAQKWRGFGPIHTLCGVIESADPVVTEDSCACA